MIDVIGGPGLDRIGAGDGRSVAAPADSVLAAADGRSTAGRSSAER